MSKYQRQLKLSSYQLHILFDMKCGASLHVNEPPTYKTWLQYPDGKQRFIRFDSAVKIKTIYNGNKDYLFTPVIHRICYTSCKHINKDT